jgi:uncharacterized damage-inducible protein DinB
MTQTGMSPEFAADMRETLLQWSTREVETTKKVISAIPDEKANYQPDPNARTAWELAWHLVSFDVHVLNGIADLKLGMDFPHEKTEPKTIAELVDWYDRNFKRAAERIRLMTPEQLATPVNFIGAFDLPALAYLAFFNNHRVHHRGQLSVYLRPMGSKCPAIYGASFDQRWAGNSSRT